MTYQEIGAPSAEGQPGRPGRPALVRGLVVAFGCALAVTTVQTEAAEMLASDAAAEDEVVTAPDAPSAEESRAAVATETESTKTWRDKFQIFGHITTAYAISDRDPLLPQGTGDQQILGIPEDGTFDYRTAALQFRYLPKDGHSIVLQLSHRELGDSGLDDITDPVELDWLFWRWVINDRFSIRVGRFAPPAGNFNEVRDVGTILPFFRPAFVTYREGGFWSEYVDGVGLTWTSDLGSSGWSVDTDLFYGRYSTWEQGFDVFGDTSLRTYSVDVEDVYGAHLWFQTPIDGVRFGLGGIGALFGDESRFNTTEARWKVWTAAIDVGRGRWTARFDLRLVNAPLDIPPVFIDGEVLAKLPSGHVGFDLDARNSIYVQGELADLLMRSDRFPPGPGRIDYDEREDIAVGWVHRLNSGIVLKAEYHWEEAEIVGFTPEFTPDVGLLFQPSTFFVEGNYTILSASYTF